NAHLDKANAAAMDAIVKADEDEGKARSLDRMGIEPELAAKYRQRAQGSKEIANKRARGMQKVMKIRDYVHPNRTADASGDAGPSIGALNIAGRGPKGDQFDMPEPYSVRQERERAAR